MRFSFILFIALIIVSCTDSTATVGFVSDDEFFPNVMPELRPFFISFEEAASARGFDIDLTELGVTGNIVELGNNSVAGVCRHLDDQPSRIAVDIDAWVRADEDFKELIVFHELGHCVLNQDHRDDSTNGMCLSIMHSGLTDCVTPLSNEAVRKIYLDELFFF